MSDFDIASSQNGPSFLESLKRRKAFGLNESDEEDNTILKKTCKPKSKKNKKSKSTQPDTTTTASDNSSPSQPAAFTSNVNPYLVSDIELDTLFIAPTAPSIAPTTSYIAPTTLTPQPEPNTQSTDNPIDLSDKEGNLDFELASLTRSTAGSSAQPEKIVVKLQYTHNFNFENLTESSKRSIKFLEKPVKIKVMDNTEFRIILSNFCASKKYLNIQDVYLTYNGDIVFLSGTPASIGMKPSGSFPNSTTNKMEVYPKKCYDNMLTDNAEQKQQERMKAANENEEDFDDDSILNAAEQCANVDEERVRLNLRTSDKQMISFRVKHTTTLRELVDAFKARAQVSGDVELSFEGETLDLDETIEDTDLEDQDIVEVITK